VTLDDQQDAAPPPSQARRSNWTAGRIVAMVLTSIGGLIGLALIVGGIAILAAVAFGRDDDGYFTTDREQLESATYAITTGEIDLGVDADEWAPDDVLGNVRIETRSAEPVFVGVGSDADVSRYLADVAQDELIDFDGGPEYELHQGERRPTPPGEQDFWVAQAQGSGEQTLEWDAGFGNWTALVMNADASRNVSVEAEAGVKLDWAVWAGLGILVAGLVIGGGAVALILLIGRRASRDPLTSG
jgi:hypothetical protein